VVAACMEANPRTSVLVTTSEDPKAQGQKVRHAALGVIS
jgi:hypothetical protein